MSHYRTTWVLYRYIYLVQYTHKIKSNWAKSHVLPLWLTCIVRPIYKQGCSIMLFIILVSFLAKRSSYEGIFEHVSRNFSNFLGNTPACCPHTLLMDELGSNFWLYSDENQPPAVKAKQASKQCSCCFPHQCTCCGQHRPTAAAASWLTHAMAFQVSECTQWPQHASTQSIVL